MRFSRYTVSGLLLFVTGLLLSGCDSGDPIDGVDPGEVAGTYQFTELRFEPVNPSLAAVNVLTQVLEPQSAQIELTDGRQFILRYRLRGGAEQVVTGSFNVGERRLELRGREDDRQHFRNLLLERTTTLQRDPANPKVLTAQIERTVNQDPYPTFYEGIGAVQGTVRLRLTRP